MLFLYFKPGVKEVTADIFRKAGLDYAVRKDMLSSECNGGPDDTAGAICCPGFSGIFGYRADSQKWEQIHGTDMWVGFDTREPPSVEELAREDQVLGEYVELGDGQSWMIPIARQWIEEGERIVYAPKLPRSREYADGKWRSGDVVPSYIELWNHATSFWDALTAATVTTEGSDTIASVQWTYQEETDACVCALQANYHVGPTEVSELKLLDDTTASKIMGVVVELASFETLIKKKHPPFATSPFDNGPPVSSQAISQAS